MPWSTKKRIVVACSVGFGLAIVGAVMIPLMNWIIKKKIESSVIIQEGGPVYEYWLDPPIPIYMQFYMFNLTNKDEFLRGAKASLVQCGPYTYSERRVKFNITWNENGTVTYRQKRIFNFLPDMTNGSESDLFVLPNPVFWALFNALKLENPIVRELVHTLIEVFDEHALSTRTMKEFIWGYRDPLLNISKGIDPNWFYTDIVGFFMNKNDTDDGVYTVYTGAKDITLLGIIDKYNGTSYLNFWSTKWANMVNGTDGTLGGPYQSKDTMGYSFSSDICRSVPGVFVKEVQSPQGIGLWRYGAPPGALANATVNPDNVGFCTPDKNSCLGSGIFNVTTCQMVDFFNLPAALSFPHFLYGDERYIKGVEGLHPDVEEHMPIVDLEPYTGLVLRAKKKLQVNMYVAPIANVSETYGITPVFLPLFWINESAVVDDKSAAKLKAMLFTPLLVIHIVEIFLMSCGALVLIVTVIYGVWKYRQISATQAEMDDSDTRPIISTTSNNEDTSRNQFNNSQSVGSVNPILE